MFLLVLAIAVSSCGSPAPDPKVEDNRLESAKKMRSAFDKAGGDITKLSPEERAELVKLFDGNEKNAEQAWNFMKMRSSGGGTPTGASGATGAPGGFAPGMPGGVAPGGSAPR